MSTRTNPATTDGLTDTTETATMVGAFLPGDGTVDLRATPRPRAGHALYVLAEENTCVPLPEPLPLPWSPGPSV